MNQKTKNIILIGGGGHCKSCIEVIESNGNYHIAGILDLASEIGKDILGIKVIGSDDDLEKYKQAGYVFLIAIGQIKTPDIRIKIFNKLKSIDASIETIVASTAYVSEHAQLGEGTVVMHNAFINAGVVIEENCIINSGALIEHDAVVRKHTHISTKAAINGDCRIGHNCFIGSHATVSSQISIGHDVIIGAGTVVNKNITESGTYVGNPAKKIK